MPRSKKAKSIDDLPWKSVSDDGILQLEELDGVQVVYHDTDAGRTVKFNVLSPEPTHQHRDVDHDHDTTTWNGIEIDSPFESHILIPEWHALALHPTLLRALHQKQFLTPTPIQAAAIPQALKRRDLVGLAQTGSGKTLAFGLPILHHLLSLPRPCPSKKRRPVKALILAPTRELAFQVSSHLNSIITSIEYNKDQPEGTPKRPPYVSIAAIVGGMSSQKQKRVLDRGLDILVATPGRLWDILQHDDTLSQEIRRIRFLVLDEADRMVQAGHFAELDNILRLTLRRSRVEEEEEEASNDDAQDDLQTFVFSATLSKELQVNLKKKKRGRIAKHQKQTSSTLDDLLLQLDFRDPDPVIIDLSPKGGIVSTLQEGKIECLSEDKDFYLYYFLLRHPGKTLVFLSSIDGIRRLVPLLELLKINVFGLHSQLEQRQRLKNLDRFTNTSKSVLLATDIAARGLDIQAVDHVVHFQVPRSADMYVHRNGRTARAMRDGFSMLMISPDERRVVKALLNSLNRDVDQIQTMSIEHGILDEIKVRVRLARKIDGVRHKAKKTRFDRGWMRETAEVLGVELDSDFERGSDSENENTIESKKRKREDRREREMKDELEEMISKPVVARGVLRSYITSGTRCVVDDLIGGELNEDMFGLKKAEAGSSLVKVKRRRKGEGK